MRVLNHSKSTFFFAIYSINEEQGSIHT